MNDYDDSTHVPLWFRLVDRHPRLMGLAVILAVFALAALAVTAAEALFRH